MNKFFSRIKEWLKENFLNNDNQSYTKSKPITKTFWIFCVNKYHFNCLLSLSLLMLSKYVSNDLLFIFCQLNIISYLFATLMQGFHHEFRTTSLWQFSLSYTLKCIIIIWLNYRIWILSDFCQNSILWNVMLKPLKNLMIWCERIIYFNVVDKLCIMSLV